MNIRTQAWKKFLWTLKLFQIVPPNCIMFGKVHLTLFRLLFLEGKKCIFMKSPSFHAALTFPLWKQIQQCTVFPLKYFHHVIHKYTVTIFNMYTYEIMNSNFHFPHIFFGNLRLRNVYSILKYLIYISVHYF